jgi:hypothetical protein
VREVRIPAKVISVKSWEEMTYYRGKLCVVNGGQRLYLKER